MPTTPKISVIIAVFNAEATLQRCLESVIEQTYVNIEIIVIDGGSSDGTIDVINKYSGHVDYWESSPDRGIYDAWNKALRHVSGDWIFFLGADDFLWDSTSMESLAEFLTNTPNIPHVVYGKAAILHSSGRVLRIAGENWEIAGPRFKQAMSLPHQSVFHHRSIFELHGVFDDSFSIAGDYELLLRELKVGKAAFFDQILTAMQIGGRSYQSSKTLKEFYLAKRRHGEHFISAWLYYIYELIYLYAVKIGQMVRKRDRDSYDAIG